MKARAETKTGGRNATDKRIMGNVALAINHPKTPAPKGWEWRPLTSLARMESGHTPSRRRKDYWNGDIPWIGIKDAKRWHGSTVEDTLEKASQLGIDNSSARVLPAGTICLSRTASVGYAIKMGRDMATSQDFANWVCSERLDPDFLRYLFIAEGSAFSRFSSGSVHQTIYYPELKAFHVCVPDVKEQKRIVAVLDQAFAALDRAVDQTSANLKAVGKLFDAVASDSLETVVNAGGLEKVGEVADHCLGKMLDKNKNKGELRSYLRNINVRWFQVESNDLLEMKIEDSEIERYAIRRGDLLICEGGYPGRASIYKSDEPVFFQKALHRVRFGRKYLAEILMYWLYIKDGAGVLNNYFTGAGISHFTGKSLSQFPFPVADEQTLAKCVTRIDTAWQSTKSLRSTYEKKLVDLSELRQSLLQKAFSGELT